MSPYWRAQDGRSVEQIRLQERKAADEIVSLGARWANQALHNKHYLQAADS